MVYGFCINGVRVLRACDIAPCGVQTFFPVNDIFLDFGDIRGAFRFCVFHAEKSLVCARVYDGGACLFLRNIYTFFDQRSENRNRIFARVPIQLLRISLHALHCDEQLKNN